MNTVQFTPWYGIIPYGIIEEHMIISYCMLYVPVSQLQQDM
jgi:hypothetical protein